MLNRLQKFSAIALISLVYLNSYAQNAQLNLVSSNDCLNSDYCVTIQVKSEDGLDFNLGTSSIFLLYNEQGLKFKSYQSLNFDENTDCKINGIQSFDGHRYDADSPGKLNTTVNLRVIGADCAVIGSEYIDVAEVCFRVTDLSKRSNVRFSEKHTHFNLDKDEIQLIENVKYGRLNDNLNCKAALDYSIEMSVINNPVSDNAEILVNSLINDNMDLKMFDMVGNLIYTKRMSVYKNQTSNFQLDFADLPAGVYFLINGNNPRTNELKIVKQ